MLEASRLDEIVEQVVRSLEFSVLAKYAFSLAQAIQRLLQPRASRSSILNEERDDVRRWRAAAVILRSQSADSNARPDGHRSAATDVGSCLDPSSDLASPSPVHGSSCTTTMSPSGGRAATWVLDSSRDRPADVLANAAGLLLTGGNDVLPSRYGEPSMQSSRPRNPGVTTTSSSLRPRSRSRDCRCLRFVAVSRC